MNINSALTKNYVNEQLGRPAQNETNFTRLRPIHNFHKNNELKQKTNNGHLAKTNPIKSTFTNLKSEMCDLKSRLRQFPLLPLCTLTGGTISPLPPASQFFPPQNPPISVETFVNFHTFKQSFKLIRAPFRNFL